MGYGPVKNGRHLPIAPWAGSWAQQEQQRREQQGKDWPLGHRLPPVSAPPKKREGW